MGAASCPWPSTPTRPAGMPAPQGHSSRNVPRIPDRDRRQWRKEESSTAPNITQDHGQRQAPHGDRAGHTQVGRCQGSREAARVRREKTMTARPPRVIRSEVDGSGIRVCPMADSTAVWYVGVLASIGKCRNVEAKELFRGSTHGNFCLVGPHGAIVRDCLSGCDGGR
jgi:hypothetical protein